MLKLKYLYENYDLARSALKNWEYDADTLDDSLQHFRISSNAVYPFYRQGTKQFLRLSPAPEKLLENLRGELEFLCYLQDKQYPAVIPVASASGEYVVTLDTVWGKYYASVFEGVSGTCIEDTDCSDRILFAYGQALARLHMLSAKYSPHNRKWTYRDVLSWIGEVLAHYRAPDKMSAELDAVRQALDGLPQTDDTYGLVHYDFEPDNVFWDETNQCCTAIDFEDGMYHFFLVDLEQALDALSKDMPADRIPTARNSFLQGYQSEHALGFDPADQLKLMRRFCDLYSYARLIRCVAETFCDEPDWMVRLREKLNRKIELIENGVAG